LSFDCVELGELSMALKHTAANAAFDARQAWHMESSAGPKHGKSEATYATCGGP
jgi:hypothetical protein